MVSEISLPILADFGSFAPSAQFIFISEKRLNKRSNIGRSAVRYSDSMDWDIILALIRLSVAERNLSYAQSTSLVSNTQLQSYSLHCRTKASTGCLCKS